MNWSLFFAEAGGFEPPVRLPVRQFSKLVVSATHPTFLLDSFLNHQASFSNAIAKVQLFFGSTKFFLYFFCFYDG